MEQCGRSAPWYKEGIRKALAIPSRTDFGWSDFRFAPGKGNLEIEGFGVVHSGHGVEFRGGGLQAALLVLHHQRLPWPAALGAPAAYQHAQLTALHLPSKEYSWTTLYLRSF